GGAMAPLFFPCLVSSLTRQLSHVVKYTAVTTLPAMGAQRCVSTIAAAMSPARGALSLLQGLHSPFRSPLLGQCQQLMCAQPSDPYRTTTEQHSRVHAATVSMKFANSRRLTTANGDDSRLSAHFRNPFTHELRFTALQKVKIAVMTVTLFPVRLLFAAFMMLLAWPFAFVATMGRSEDAVEPLSWWRWLVDLALKAIMRTMWFSGGFHWVRVKGRPALPSEAPILTLAPHSSYFDAIPVTMTMASIVMKAESRDVPVWGTLIKFIRPVFVSRSDQDSRRKTVEEIKRRAFSAGEWPQIMIFPEGTCTNRSCLIAFKPDYVSHSGHAPKMKISDPSMISKWENLQSRRVFKYLFPHCAFIPGVPVQPVVLRYPNQLDTISWTWQGPGAFKILWLTLCQLHNSIEIEYLPTYTPSEAEKRDPALFASNVRRIMAKALQLPIIDYSFEDCQLTMTKGPLSLPSHTCLLEFSRLVRRLGLKAGVSNQVLQEESSRARRLCGRKLSLEGFAEYVHLPVTEALQDIFALFEEHGQMDVREYIIALSVVCRPFRYLDTIQLAFRMFEAEEDGAIVEDELAIILNTALGVADLTVCDVFRAIDTEDKGKITCDDFLRFVESCPNFVELYHCVSHLVTPTSSELPEPKTNSFCPDFSPQDQTTANNSNNKKQD
ncbi:hypothetical protein NFI96_019232, partial [Prochilodus magdalenae]